MSARFTFGPAWRIVSHRMKHGAILFLLIGCLVAPARAAEPEISLLDNSVLRVRANPFPEDFAARLRAAEPTNRLAGTVLDLRFADSVATNAAEQFIRRQSPLVILVNSQTRGGAAALVAQLRADSSVIVIGSTNPPGKISPDIAVTVSVDDEKQFVENPYFKAASPSRPLSGTNNLLAIVDHTSEAELVRKRIKDGDEDTAPTPPRIEPPQPVIRDPALARAVDLLKALAVLHKSRG